MGFSCGIVGLPNVGKSTLFNAMTATQAATVGNFPFCTIDPNIGQVPVPDDRLNTLTRLSHSRRTVPTTIDFVDIAGLVAGAAQGEGLGNRFLAHIREVDTIVHMVRCFGGNTITHVSDTANPVRDAQIVDTELLLADLASVEKQRANLIKKIRSGQGDVRELDQLLEQAQQALSDGVPLRDLILDLEPEQRLRLSHQGFITDKPLVMVANVHEDDLNGNDYTRCLQEAVGETEIVILCAEIEAQLALLEGREADELRAAYGVCDSGLNQLIKAGYKTLGLKTFFTSGEKESRAWTVPHGTNAPQAAGKIHQDFQRGFICAEVVAYDEFVLHGGDQESRNAGVMRQEGRDYLITDGDVILFRFNV